MPTRRCETVTEFLTTAIAASGKTQRAIADDAGLRNPNVLSQLKSGTMKLPLERVGPLARALNVDPVRFLNVAMNEYYPDTWPTICASLIEPPLTQSELDLIEALRSGAGGLDIDWSKREIQEQFVALLRRSHDS